MVKVDGSLGLSSVLAGQLLEGLSARKAGLPPIRLHDLRHCAATLAYAAGADTKMVSTMLRHSSTNLPENTYTTVLPEPAHAAAEASVAIVPRTLRIPGER
ncbi:tyrosine-type recombinase/integrase [Nonomuraea wenchangensis]|uniref:tyrosine-type recombinase/integrase n=1 Tax=Nonomuraea wenchangensis TaxID=568860 RepID=UPI0033DFE97F